jgi:hypothetical protein
MSVVRLSSDSPAIASADVDEIRRKDGAVPTNKFRIDYRVLPFEEWDGFLGDFKQGKLRFSETEVEFGRTVDIAGSLGTSRADSIRCGLNPNGRCLRSMLTRLRSQMHPRIPSTGSMRNIFKGQ